MPTAIPLLIPLANFPSAIFVTNPRLRPAFCNSQVFSHYCLHRELKPHNNALTRNHLKHRPAARDPRTTGFCFKTNQMPAISQKGLS
jgi:hypothetical protein